MNTFDKNMEKLFDVTPIEPKEQPLVPIEEKSETESLELKQDLVDAYNNRPLKFKINRIKGITDLTGHKVRGSSGWKIEISIPLN